MSIGGGVSLRSGIVGLFCTCCSSSGVLVVVLCIGRCRVVSLDRVASRYVGLVHGIGRPDRGAYEGWREWDRRWMLVVLRVGGVIIRLRLVLGG